MLKKNFPIILSFCFMLFFIEVVNAQKKKKDKKEKTQTYQEAPSSRNPGYNQQNVQKSSKTAAKGKSNSYMANLDRKVDEYHERMKDNAKRYKKMARLSKKPQYSDPTYFGHKRKPKKRPPGKRKLCKECEIVH